MTTTPLWDLLAETGPVPHTDAEVTLHGGPVIPDVADAVRRFVGHASPDTPTSTPVTSISLTVRPGLVENPGGVVVRYVRGVGLPHVAGVISC